MYANIEAPSVGETVEFERQARAMRARLFAQYLRSAYAWTRSLTKNISDAFHRAGSRKLLNRFS